MRFDTMLEKLIKEMIAENEKNNEINNDFIKYRNELIEITNNNENIIKQYDELVREGEDAKEVYHDIKTTMQQIDTINNVWNELVTSCEKIYNDSDKEISQNYIIFQMTYLLFMCILNDKLDVATFKETITEVDFFCAQAEFGVFRDLIEKKCKEFKKISDEYDMFGEDDEDNEDSESSDKIETELKFKVKTSNCEEDDVKDDGVEVEGTVNLLDLLRDIL